MLPPGRAEGPQRRSAGGFWFPDSHSLAWFDADLQQGVNVERKDKMPSSVWMRVEGEIIWIPKMRTPEQYRHEMPKGELTVGNQPGGV
jgi:hypothetical protein